MAPQAVGLVFVQGNRLGQVVDGNVLFERLVDFLGYGWHFLAGPAIHDAHAVGAETQCRAGRVHGRVAAADDDDVFAVDPHRFTVHVIEELDALHHGRSAVEAQLQRDLLLLARGHEHAVVIPGQVEQCLAIDLVVGFDLDTEVEDAVDLLVDGVLGQPELGDAGPQQPADLTARLVHGHPVAEACEVVRRGQPRGAGTDDGDLLSALAEFLGRYMAVIAGIAFHLAHVDGAVDLDAVAGLHAGCRTGATADRRERRRAQQDLERLVRAFVSQFVQEALHVVARGADVVARRDELLPVRLLGRPLPGPDGRP